MSERNTVVGSLVSSTAAAMPLHERRGKAMDLLSEIEGEGHKFQCDVSVNLLPAQELGLTLRKTEHLILGDVLVVEAVRRKSVLLSPNISAVQVQAGDTIYQVNNVTGPAEKMLVELNKKGALKLFLQRDETSDTSIEAKFHHILDSIRDKLKGGHVRWDEAHDVLTRMRNRICPSCVPGDVSSNLKSLGDVRWFWFTHMIMVARYNFEHFHPCLGSSYSTGHRLAMRAARAAGSLAANGTKPNEEAQRQALNRAYAINAFADHMLSDMWASGHVRTPRMEIAAAVIQDPKSVSQAQGAGITAAQMHDEDGKNGLLVTNQRGDTPWMAYGDSGLFKSANDNNLRKLVEAVQLSRSQVFEAYRAGREGRPIDDQQIQNLTSQILRLQPYVPEPGDTLWHPDFLFKHKGV